MFSTYRKKTVHLAIVQSGSSSSIIDAPSMKNNIRICPFRMILFVFGSARFAAHTPKVLVYSVPSLLSWMVKSYILSPGGSKYSFESVTSSSSPSAAQDFDQLSLPRTYCDHSYKARTRSISLQAHRLRHLPLLRPCPCTRPSTTVVACRA